MAAYMMAVVRSCTGYLPPPLTSELKGSTYTSRLTYLLRETRGHRETFFSAFFLKRSPGSGPIGNWSGHKFQFLTLPPPPPPLSETVLECTGRLSPKSHTNITTMPIEREEHWIGKVRTWEGVSLDSSGGIDFLEGWSWTRVWGVCRGVYHLRRSCSGKLLSNQHFHAKVVGEQICARRWSNNISITTWWVSVRL